MSFVLRHPIIDGLSRISFGGWKLIFTNFIFWKSFINENVLFLFKNVQGAYNPQPPLDTQLPFIIGPNNYIWYDIILYNNYYYYLFIKNNKRMYFNDTRA